jgi:hypothetical protein
VLLRHQGHFLARIAGLGALAAALRGKHQGIDGNAAQPEQQTYAQQAGQQDRHFIVRFSRRGRLRGRAGIRVKILKSHNNLLLSWAMMNRRWANDGF